MRQDRLFGSVGHWDLPRLALRRLNPTLLLLPKGGTSLEEQPGLAPEEMSLLGSPGKGYANSIPSSNQDLTLGEDAAWDTEQGSGAGRRAGLWEKATSDEYIPDLAFRGLFKKSIYIYIYFCIYIHIHIHMHNSIRLRVTAGSLLALSSGSTI